MATAKQRKLRNEKIIQEHNQGIAVSRIAKNNKVTTQTVRNVIKGKFIDRSSVEAQVLDLYRSLDGELRHKIAEISEQTGLKKTQVRYIILKNDES